MQPGVQTETMMGDPISNKEGDGERRQGRGKCLSAVELFSEVAVSHPVLVLGTELGSPARVVLKH